MTQKEFNNLVAGDYVRMNADYDPLEAGTEDVILPGKVYQVAMPTYDDNYLLVYDVDGDEYCVGIVDCTVHNGSQVDNKKYNSVCPVCGSPAELLFTLRCSNPTCQNG